MRIKSSFVTAGLAATWLLFVQLNPSNPPLGRTGAPGETTCMAAGCHSGGTFTGSVGLSGLPDTVVANQTYSLTLTNTSNAVRAGFQLTCLDAANIKCGTLTTAAGVNVATSGGRQYARQLTPKTLSGGSASWTFSWKAPATLAVDSLKFYFVSLAANGNNNNSGDNVLISTKKVNFRALTSDVTDPEAASRVRIYPNPAKDVVRVALQEAASGQLSLFDNSGRRVLQQTLDADTALDVAQLPAGLYTAEIRFDGRIAHKQLVIER